MLACVVVTLGFKITLTDGNAHGKDYFLVIVMELQFTYMLTLRSQILIHAFKIEILHNIHYKMSFFFRDCCGFCICHHIFVYYIVLVMISIWNTRIIYTSFLLLNIGPIGLMSIFQLSTRQSVSNQVGDFATSLINRIIARIRTSFCTSVILNVHIAVRVSLSFLLQEAWIHLLMERSRVFGTIL